MLLRPFAGILQSLRSLRMSGTHSPRPSPIEGANAALNKQYVQFFLAKAAATIDSTNIKADRTTATMGAA